MTSQRLHQRRSLFETLTSRPRWVLLLSAGWLVWSGVGLTHLHKDVSLEAFVPPDHPSLLADREIDATFAVGDPMALAVEVEQGRSVFEPQVLALVERLTRAVEGLDNVVANRVVSLATESSISGTAQALHVDRYLLATPINQLSATDSRGRWRQMPPHQGTLVSWNERGAMVLFELMDDDLATQTYANLQELIEDYATDGIRFHIAGPAAVSAILSDRIDKDAKAMQPLVFLVVLGFLYLAFRRVQALIAPLVVIAGATVGAMGVMAWNGVPYFAITNALPVILVAIAVADAIHILSHFYALRASASPQRTRELVVETMNVMAKPITLTTITTMAGFAGIALTSIMPPITYFAWYAALGVFLAWVFSMLTLPNLLVVLRPLPSAVFRGEPSSGGLGNWWLRVSQSAARRPKATLLLVLMAITIGGWQASSLRFDRSQVENFAPDDPVRIADEFINETFAGTAFLDVLVEASETGGLLRTSAMERIAQLQRYIDAQAHVRISVSIVDYLSLLHQALLVDVGGTGGRALQPRSLPDEEDAIAQYLLVYEASGDPTDFEEEIDSTGTRALIRIALDASHYSRTRDAVESIDRYLRDHFNDAQLSARLGGNVNLTYHWMHRLQATHVVGVLLSLLLVTLTAVLLLRSVGIGVLAVAPVSLTILLLYAVMASLQVYLEPATSMFAAISVGLGVDFAIHLIVRLRAAGKRHGQALDLVLREAVPPTARACFFNAAALGVGFCVLTASDLLTLQRFGAMIALAAFASFVLALIVIPACYGLLRLRSPIPGARRPSRAIASSLIALLLGGLCITPAPSARAMVEVDGDWVAQQVAARPEGLAVRRVIDMTLTDRRGATKQRQAVVLKRTPADGQRETRITYSAPRAVRHTSFLSHDRGSSGEDLRWLYLPATRKVRRIPANERGDHFLGTDFSYEDVQSELKFDLADYRFELLESPGPGRYLLAGVAVNAQIARQLGYGRIEALIDGESWLPISIEFFDPELRPLKIIEVRRQARIDGIWTALEIHAQHLQQQHSTLFTYRDVTYPEQLDEGYFDARRLLRHLSQAQLDP
ncbi:MAG: outer membrane lipoprotein-sorting protein [Pseudomonadota bacterium]